MGMADGAVEQGKEPCDLLGPSLNARAHPGERDLTGQDPIVQQAGMADEEGRHAQAGCVADAERTLGLRREPCRARRVPRQGDMFDQIEAELADHIDHQHLGLVGQREDAVAPEAPKIGQAELAVAVDCGGAHQISDRDQFPQIGLPTGGKAGDRGIEQAQTLVGPAEDELVGAVAGGLLARDARGQAVDRCRGESPGGKREGRVPFFRDDPIGALLGGEIAGKSRETDHAGRGLDLVNRASKALVVEGEHNPAKLPGLPAHAPDQRARKAEARWVEGAQPFGAHDQRGRTQQR